MSRTTDEILGVLDRCCDAFTFPMLDNGYVYLATTRLSLFRSPGDWALVIEVFGFSPRAGLPETHIHTFASTVRRVKTRDDYVEAQAFERYLANNPHNESHFVHPLVEGSWQDERTGEFVASGASNVVLRGRTVTLPGRKEYRRHKIKLADRRRVSTFELCRYLAAVARDDVLATPDERRINVPTELVQVLQLEEWNHPNVVDETERPSRSLTFQQLARVLETGDLGAYRPAAPANTHWSNWPDGGTL